MNKRSKVLLVVSLVVVGIIVYSWLYSFSYNQALEVHESARSLMSGNIMLVYAQPQQAGISDEDRKLFDELVKKVNENLENGTTVLTEENGTTFAINGSDGTIIATNAPTAMTVDPINETRKVLSPIQAPSPVQFDTDGSDQGVPITAPGQIAIDIISSDSSLSPVPSGWSGAMNYDGGSKLISIGGYGRDYFVVDCPAGLPYGITIQKGSEFGYIEVYITDSGKDTEFGEHEKTYESYGIISISDICP